MKPHKQHKRNKELLSHTEATQILSDPHGFWVNRENETQNPITQAFVGKNGRGEVVYMEFGIGAGDHIAVFLLRLSSLEELAFYRGDSGEGEKQRNVS